MRWINRRLHPRVDRIELIRYAGPPDGSRYLDPVFALVVRIHTEKDSLVGLGEAVVAPPHADAAWAELEKYAAKLLGSRLPTQIDPIRPLGRIAGWAAAANRGLRRPGRAARLAFELALLDLVMKTSGRSPADLWHMADQSACSVVRPLLRPPATSPSTDSNELADSLTHEAGGSWAVRMRSTGDPGRDLAWLGKISDLENRAGRDRPLWLVGRRSLNAQDACEFVRDLAGKVGRGELPSRVLVEELMAADSPLGTGQLQKVADDTLGPVVGKRVSLLATMSAGSDIQQDLGKRDARVGGICLSLAQGSWLSVRAAAGRVKRADPSILVMLIGSGQGSDISDAAAETLALATPQIDAWATSTVAGWPTLLEKPTLAAPTGRAGMFAEGDLAALSAVADRLQEYSRTRVTAVGEQPNRYDEELVPGAPLGVPKQTALEVEALSAGLRTRRYSRRLFVAEERAARSAIGFRGPQSSATSAAAALIAGHKGYTREVLLAQGLPIAPGAWFPFDELENARAVAKELGFPLVVKPADGLQGHGVTTGISSAEQLEQAFERIADSRFGSTGIVLERMITGIDYRVLATPNKAISVVRREPAAVIGDGRRTVVELVLAANVARRRNPYLGRHLIPLDSRAIALLGSQEMTPHSIPSAGQRVQLSAVANLSQGGSSRELLDSTHPSVLDLAAAAVRAIPGLPYGGVDIFLEDHGRPVAEQDVTLIEINHNPALLLHHYPMFGLPLNACGVLLRELGTSVGMALQPSRATPLTIRLTVFGEVQGVGYRAWLARAARELGLDGWVRNSVEPDQVEAVIHGSIPRVAALLRLAFSGPSRSKPVETCAEPVDAIPDPGFVIRSKARSSNGSS